MPDHASSGIQKPCCNEHLIPVMLIMTSNAPDTMYLDKMKNYQQTLSALVGPTEILISGGLGRLAAQVLQVHVKDSFFGGVENMDHSKSACNYLSHRSRGTGWLRKAPADSDSTFLPAAEVSAELLADQDALIGNLAPDHQKHRTPVGTAQFRRCGCLYAGRDSVPGLYSDYRGRGIWAGSIRA